MKDVFNKMTVEDLYFLTEEYPPRRSTSNVRVKYPNEYKKLIELTHFLSNTATTSQRLWHVRHNKLEPPICEYDDCNNPTKWTPPYSDYARFCSKKCFNKNKTKNAAIDKHQKNIEKYGESYKDLTTSDKIKLTNLKRYGVDNPFKNVNRIRKINNKKYGCDFHFQQHLSKDTLDKLNDKEWLIEMNHNQKRSCVEISDILRVNNSTVNKAMYRLGIIPNYTYASSYFEKQLSTYLKDQDITIVENDRTIIPPLELDILLPDYNIAIEYCGLYWHNELHKDSNYHKNKYERCKDAGVDLLTIYEDEWHDKPELIKSMIMHRIGKNLADRIYARKCRIEEVPSRDKKLFFNNTHVQGNGPSSINVGLYNDDILVGCMGFIKAKDDRLILNRFSTKYIVAGGFSRVLKYVIKNYSPKDIITFADLRWGSGKVYESNGFRLDKVLPPDYYYVYNNERFHKFNFRHKNLKKLLSDYDPEKSEHENCLNNNIFRIYDCGKHKYVLNINHK